ncbi:VOC family protein [Nocardia stercoris]|uniref:Uncharacterized protein n=1 Tax=Nocardia stercoris TaxID=2483361 RepID=A0A3M2KVR8_9NOCA|nr:hypothetical protein [Nocardia stercoris]RMI28776.1 hypothetical protein EBN03_28250 [Nocardia stercoris]
MTAVLPETAAVDRDGVPHYQSFIELVPAVEDAHSAEIVAAGYQLKVEPTDFGPVSLALVADPGGYVVELVAGDPNAAQSPPLGTKIPHPVPHIHEHA